MFGRGGRYICRRSPRAGHSSRWCVTVSWLLHIKHVGAILGFILFRCAFRGMCCVLNLKIMTCSCLCNRSNGSFKFGVVMCAKTALPVVSIAQLFSHSSLLLFLNIYLRCGYRSLPEVAKLVEVPPVSIGEMQNRSDRLALSTLTQHRLLHCFNNLCASMFKVQPTIQD